MWQVSVRTSSKWDKLLLLSWIWPWKVRSINPKTGILTKLYCTSDLNLVNGSKFIKWTTRDWHTDGRTDRRMDGQKATQTQATTILEDQNWPRVKSSCLQNVCIGASSHKIWRLYQMSLKHLERRLHQITHFEFFLRGPEFVFKIENTPVFKMSFSWLQIMRTEDVYTMYLRPLKIPSSKHRNNPFKLLTWKYFLDVQKKSSRLNTPVLKRIHLNFKSYILNTSTRCR